MVDIETQVDPETGLFVSDFKQYSNEMIREVTLMADSVLLVCEKEPLPLKKGLTLDEREYPALMNLGDVSLVIKGKQHLEEVLNLFNIKY